MVEILPIPPTAVAVAWPQALPLLEKPIGMSKGCYLPEDVLAACQTGGMQLWLAAEGEDLLAAYVTEIVDYPRKRIVRAAFAGGVPQTMDRWLEPMVNMIEAWSKQVGCQSFAATGRKGWSRKVEGEEIGVILWRDYPAMELH